jgi:HSP20 family molecular chaperone IbpA
VVELPAGVDASKSVAVMADGVVAIRMPKVVVAEVEVAAASV